MYEIYEKLLKMHGVTTYQVCKATGISQTTISTWKARKNILKTTQLKKIAEYFNVSVDYMLGVDTCEVSKTDAEYTREKRIMEYAKRLLALDEKSLKTIEDMISIMEKAQL